MTNTNYGEFLKFTRMIKEKTMMENVWLFRILENKKIPFCIRGTVLKNNENYRINVGEAVKLLKFNQNVGIYALKGGLSFLDIDTSDGKVLASQAILSMLDSISTLTVKTRSGGYHYYFKNNGMYPNQLLKENGVVIGELRTNWQYVVSVGSFCQGSYTIEKLNPIKSISDEAVKILNIKDNNDIQKVEQKNDNRVIKYQDAQTYYDDLKKKNKILTRL